jgi:hypothetical protein
LIETKKEFEESKNVLKIKVKTRTKELEELEKFQKIVVGRELKMIELKKRIEELEKKLKSK